MKILEINTVCDKGSTGRIAAGVARCASAAGHEVFFAYGRGNHPEDICGYRIGNPIDFACHVLINFFGGKSGFGSRFVTRKFLKWVDGIQPDVIHLHNLHGFYIHVGILFDYIKKKGIPVIWTLHDCWPFTGQCAHFDYAGCERWREGCHDCPIYRTDYPYSLFSDSSRQNYLVKKSLFTCVNTMVVVTPSMWLEKLVRESFLKDYEVRTINNGIDLSRFKVIDANSQELLSLRLKCKILPTDKVVLGVANVWNKKKGLNTFIELAEKLENDYVIVLVGLSGLAKRRVNIVKSDRIVGIAHTESIDELVMWYNIADVFVNPTLEDNFPTTNIEALACGTSVITYDTGGSPEIIDSNTGVVVEKGNVTQLAKAIKEVCEKGKKTKEQYCLNRSKEYDSRPRYLEYIELIEKMEVNAL